MSRGLTFAVPAIVATAILLVLDTVIRAAMSPGLDGSALLVLPLYQVLLLVLPAAIVALAVVALLAIMQGRAPDPRTACLLVGLSTLAWMAAATGSVTGFFYSAIIAIGGAVVGWVSQMEIPRTRRLVVSLAIVAVALVILGFGV